MFMPEAVEKDKEAEEFSMEDLEDRVERFEEIQEES